MPQPPQFAASLRTSTQAPVHAVSPGAQAATHSPDEQSGGSVQAVSQVPQWLGSEAVCVHTPPHSVPPNGQAQAAFPHVWPPVHTTPQPPQFASSPFGLTHAPPQAI